MQELKLSDASASRALTSANMPDYLDTLKKTAAGGSSLVAPPAPSKPAAAAPQVQPRGALSTRPLTLAECKRDGEGRLMYGERYVTSEPPSLVSDPAKAIKVTKDNEALVGALCGMVHI